MALLTGGVVHVWATRPAVAQSTQPATAGSAGWELPADVRAALAQTEDFAFNFDQPGFYAVLEQVKHSRFSPGHTQAPIEIEDWRDLLERPNEFRGRPVTVSGSIGRNKAPYTLPTHPELGPLWQIELRRPDQPLTCTLILTEDAADLPLNANVAVTGYFVMIRQYHGPSKRVHQSALLVAPGPTEVGKTVARPNAGKLDWEWMALAVLLGLIVTVVLLRRSGRRGRPDFRSLRARQEAPMNLADDLAEWADRKDDDDR